MALATALGTKYSRANLEASAMTAGVKGEGTILDRRVPRELEVGVAADGTASAVVVVLLLLLLLLLPVVF